MCDPADEMQAYYAARAPYYDAVYLKPERREDIAFLSTHIPERLAGRQVLEVACGTGYWTRHIVKTALRLVATDGTAEPLAFARLRPGADRVAFHLADAYALPKDLGMFDAAFAGLWFSHVPVQKRVQFLRGLHSLLEPGARVVFIDNNEVQCRDFPIVERDLHGNTYQRRRLRDGTVHRVLKNFPSEPELRELLLPFADEFAYGNLQNFWLLEYRVHGRTTSLNPALP
jgi:demethylmenaquinone methyltransferase/2-methoxy-6-polyprenyl-1,4-benzoquinol methylase